MESCFLKILKQRADYIDFFTIIVIIYSFFSKDIKFSYSAFKERFYRGLMHENRLADARTLKLKKEISGQEET